MAKVFAVIRIRGSMETRTTVEHALEFMQLFRKNNCVFVADNPASRGTLQFVKDFVTWGEVAPETVLTLLEKRARVVANKPLTVEYLSKNSKFKTFKELADAIADGSAHLKDVKGLKPLVRLNPPKKGFECGIKNAFPKGALGYRKEAINELLLRMA